jgi:hypothetical protein
MKFSWSLFFLLLSPYFLFAQESSRVAVPGTHCTIIPPEHFLPAEGFAGFSSEEAGASISVVDVNASLKDMTENFAPKSGGSTFIKIKRTDTLLVEGKEAFIWVYTKKSDDKNLEVQVYIVGNSKHSVIVTASYGTDKEGLAPLMRDALLTARFDERLTANPEVAAPFSVDGKRWGFKPYLFVGTKLIYKGRDVWVGGTGEFEISSASKKFTPDEKEAFLQMQIQRLSDKKIELISMRPVTIQYMDGFELMGRGNTADHTATLHYTVLFQDDAERVYTMLGSASYNPKYWDKRFRALAQSFKLK